MFCRRVFVVFIINFCLLFLNSGLSAYNINEQYKGGCACGCACGQNCSCGCVNNKNCDCLEHCRIPVCYPYHKGSKGAWFPETPPLFKPFIADPREITFSLGWRFHDRLFGDDIVDVSYGDALPIYEWCDVWRWHGKLRIEVEGALWAVFAPHEESAPLINADYYVGIPVTYAFDNWSFRWRIYHISSHIGDEFLLDHIDDGFERFNPSAEYTDFFVSNQFTDDIRLYGGAGLIIHQDPSFHCGPLYAEAGMEIKLHALEGLSRKNNLYGIPFFAMHFRYNRVFKHHVDATYALGYEWGKIVGLCRKVRVFFEYHDGYSLEGQFCKFPTSYLALRMTYGF